MIYLRPMRIAITGGGITGLTAGYILTKSGHTVTIFEKESYLGGLAYGFKQKNWEWSLEAAYHHLFTNDDAILSLLNEIGLKDKVIIKRPVTATLYQGKTYQLDSAKSLLTFPGLSFIDRLRTGILIGVMKLNPWWQPLEAITAHDLFKTLGGNEGWKTIWEPLMTGKFGTYADTIAASWLWARIKKRTPSLAYIEGGFQTFINRLEKKIKDQGGTIFTGTAIKSIDNDQPDTFVIHHGNKKETFDKVLLTIPTPLATKVINFDQQQTENRKTSNFKGLTSYFQKPLTIPHLHAQVLILETTEPLLKDTYWLNITDRSFPFLAVVAHTNYMDKRHYGGHNITYVGNYLPATHPFIKLTKEELIKTFLPYLKKLNPSITYSQLTTYNPQLFTAPFAQPVQQKHYSTLAPKLQTPIPNLYLANMDSIYPWDRGTNYAVELGEKAAKTMMM